MQQSGGAREKSTNEPKTNKKVAKLNWQSTMYRRFSNANTENAIKILMRWVEGDAGGVWETYK